MVGVIRARRAQFDAAMADIQRLRASGDVDGLKAALRSPLGNDDLNIRALAARALGELGATSAHEDLGQLLTHDGSEMARIVAAQALGRIGSPESVFALVHGASDVSPYVRMHAVRALGEVGSAEAVPVLVGTLDDASWKVRVWAAEALAALGATGARDDIEQQRRRELRPRARRLMKRALRGL